MARHQHHVDRVLPYTPAELFDLVGDVRRYPEFLPWVKSIHTGPTRREGESVSILEAEAKVGFSFLNERFSTRVRRDGRTLEIEVKLISGPFKSLLNRWTFKDDPAGAAVSFDIDFEFKSPLLDRLLRANFNTAVDRLIASFEARAQVLYGAAAARA